ncbi:MAG TPA: plastocyanin/azurin family copper-binding protein [Nitrososphaerales archaeon]|nr:plastocyanin/azurin family copper-binding protein [Nitrososphaerales archaeon]
MSTRSSTVVGAIVAVLIIGAVAGIGYYQVVIAPTFKTSTSTGPSVTCPSSACVNVTIPSGASTIAPGFSPDTVTIVIGVNNTVFWTNSDDSGTPHTVTYKSGPDNSLASPTLNRGETYTFTFTTPGTYGYYCTFHPAVMTGTVIVKTR